MGSTRGTQTLTFGGEKETRGRGLIKTSQGQNPMEKDLMRKKSAPLHIWHYAESKQPIRLISQSDHDALQCLPFLAMNQTQTMCLIDTMIEFTDLISPLNKILFLAAHVLQTTAIQTRCFTSLFFLPLHNEPNCWKVATSSLCVTASDPNQLKMPSQT